MKILYLNDDSGTFFCSAEEEVQEYSRILELNGYPAARRVRDYFDFCDGNFDVLIFDYGGITINGGPRENDIFDYFSRLIVQLASDYPSRIFYVKSAFNWGVKEAEKEFGTKSNIFYDEEDFFTALEYLKGKESNDEI